MKREGKHILETIERYAKPPYDYLTDDMTVPFALELAEKDREIARLRAELEVSEAVNRAKTELLMDVSMMLSDGELTPTQRVLNAGTAIVVRTGPPRTKNRPQDVREIVAALDHQQKGDASK